jgi:preprotein translocase subunit SecE
MAKNDSAKKGLKGSDKDLDKSVESNSKSPSANNLGSTNSDLSNPSSDSKPTDRAIASPVNTASNANAKGNVKDKDGIVQKTGLVSFFKDVQIELSKVAWPSRQQLISESIAVLLMVIVAAILVYFVDSLFSWAASKVFQ